MTERTRFVGLDAHARTIAVAVAEEAGAPGEHGVIPNDPSSVRRLVGRLGGPGVRLVACYEAGPTGYALHRQLQGLGVECMVVAPSLVPIRSGDRVKTDRRDALKLARLLRSGDLTPVWVPDEEHEAFRDLVRARADAKVDALRAKHRLSKFLLRRGVRPPHGVRAWTDRHWSWLGQIRLEEPSAQIVLADYLSVVRAAEERVRRLHAALHTAVPDRHRPLVAALQAVRGIAFLTAATIVAEVGDLRRFASAPQFMAYVGVVPSEYSSGASRHRGRITKAGNAMLRHVLVEAAHHSRLQPRVGTTLRARQQAAPAAVVELSWRAQVRLHHRYRHLSARLGRPKAVTAVSRELAGFVWAVGQQLEVPAA
jgi:transposase